MAFGGTAEHNGIKHVLSPPVTSLALVGEMPIAAAAHDAKWGQFVIDPAFFTKLVYEGV
ncbi:MAG: hypothetical protein WCD26_22950 [Pseudolabrys sp.]